MRNLVLAGLMTMLVAMPAAAQQPGDRSLPVEEMRKAIEEGVDYILSKQLEDGTWRYREDSNTYDVGLTALCTLALRHSTLTKAIVPAQKGLAFVAQSAPEPQTYSAGLAEMLLYEAGERQFQTRIGQYALMTIYGQLATPTGRGGWSYKLVTPRNNGTWPPPPEAGGDHSNGQFGVLALYFAEKAGFQVPVQTWMRVKDHYEWSQDPSGAWGYITPAYAESINRETSIEFSMTTASTISLYLADEALESKEHRQCKMRPDNPKVLAGMEWVGKNMRSSGPYDWYALERLGVLSGRSEFAGKDWLGAGTEGLLRNRTWGGRGGPLPNTAFAVLFLARALEPVMINKLQYAGDWNNDPYDIKHLVEYVTTKYQNPRQWRIVTLDAPVEHLLRVPILYLSGHDELKFDDAEKAKLKEYVNRGGMIFGMACCSSKPFDKSFRELVAELWPAGQLTEVPKTHPLFQYPKRNPSPPSVLGLSLNNGQGRLGVVYSPYDLCCRWHRGGKEAEPSYALGVNLIFYEDVVASRQGAVKAGYEVVNTAGPETPAQGNNAEQTPEP